MRIRSWRHALFVPGRLCDLALCLFLPGIFALLTAQTTLPETTAARGLVINERAEYALAFKGLGAAEASIQFSPGAPQGIEARIDTKTLTSLIFSVHNTYAAIIDRESGLPVMIRKIIAQSNISQNLSIIYDRTDNTAKSSNLTSWSILPGAMDLFTMLYQLRMRSPVPGDAISYPLDIESQAWIAAGEVVDGGAIEGPGGRLETRKITFHFSRNDGAAARSWKTDLLTNRIARTDGQLTIFLGPPPENIPLLLRFGPAGQQVTMRLKHYEKGKN